MTNKKIESLIREIISLEIRNSLIEANEPIITGELAKRIMFKGVDLRSIPQEKIYELYDELSNAVMYYHAAIAHEKSPMGDVGPVHDKPPRIRPDLLRGPKGPDAIIEDAIYRAIILFTVANVDSVKDPMLFDEAEAETWNNTVAGTWYDAGTLGEYAGNDSGDTLESIAHIAEKPKSNDEIHDGPGGIRFNPKVGTLSTYLDAPHSHPDPEGKGEVHKIERARVIRVDYQIANYICTLLANRPTRPAGKDTTMMHTPKETAYRGMTLPANVVAAMIINQNGPYNMGDISSWSLAQNTAIGFMKSSYREKVRRHMRSLPQDIRSSYRGSSSMHRSNLDILTHELVTFSTSLSRIFLIMEKTHRGTYISALSGFQDEEEVLSGGKFKIVKYVKSDGEDQVITAGFSALARHAIIPKVKKTIYHTFYIEQA